MVKDAKAKPRLYGGNLSLSERVRLRLAKDDRFAELREAMEARMEDPDLWEMNKDQWSEQINEAIRLCVMDTHVMVATPVAARRLATKFPSEFKPAVILVEEAGRMTEPDVMSLLGHFPGAVYAVVSGDFRQIGPHVFSRMAHKKKKTATETSDINATDCDEDAPFINHWGTQMGTSILDRTHKTGSKVHELNTNWRSHFGVEILPSTLAYGGRMISGYGNTEIPPEATLAHRFIHGFAPKARHNVMFIDIKNDKEAQEGPSVSNPQHATFIASLVASIFEAGLCKSVPVGNESGKRARILVMSPYSAQVCRLNWAIGALSRAEYVPELVDVRTVDAAMGDTADVAILDLTRSKDVGFTNDLAQLNMGLTRARYAQFIIGNSKVAAKAPNIKKILTWCTSSDAVCTIRDRQVPGDCNTCYGPAHKKACREKLTCKNCGQSHYARNCRASIKKPMTKDLSIEDCPGLTTDATEEASDSKNPEKPSNSKGPVQQVLESAAQRRDKAAEVLKITSKATDPQVRLR